MPKAKSGYDQLDYLTGLLKFYITATKKEKHYDALERGKRIAEENKSEKGIALMKVWENMAAWAFESDVDKAFRLSEEAVRIATQSSNKDVLLFAMYNLAENYSYEKNDFGKELNNGKILVKSEPKIRTTFIIRFSIGHPIC